MDDLDEDGRKLHEKLLRERLAAFQKKLAEEKKKKRLEKEQRRKEKAAKKSHGGHMEPSGTEGEGENQGQDGVVTDTAAETTAAENTAAETTAAETTAAETTDAEGPPPPELVGILKAPPAPAPTS